jgi:hypothetical protein
VLVSRKTAAVQELEDATRNKTTAQISVREVEGHYGSLRALPGPGANVRRAESELESAVDTLAQKKAL